jgi:putative peptidoglycan lipid II flippase
LGLIALALPISRLIFQHVNSGDADAELIARVIASFAVGLPVFSTFQLLTRTFYAMQDTRAPALVNVAAAVVNIGADLLFMVGLNWGVPGLALGWAVSYGFGTVVMLVIMRGRLHGLDGRRVGTTLARTLPAAVLAALAARAATLPFGRESQGVLTDLGVVVVGVVVGVLAFGILALIFRIREVDDVKAALVRRFRG